MSSENNIISMIMIYSCNIWENIHSLSHSPYIMNKLCIFYEHNKINIKGCKNKIYYSPSDYNDWALVLQSQECLTMLNGFVTFSFVYSLRYFSKFEFPKLIYPSPGKVVWKVELIKMGLLWRTMYYSLQTKLFVHSSPILRLFSKQ